MLLPLRAGAPKLPLECAHSHQRIMSERDRNRNSPAAFTSGLYKSICFPSSALFFFPVLNKVPSSDFCQWKAVLVLVKGGRPVRLHKCCRVPLSLRTMGAVAKHNHAGTANQCCNHGTVTCFFAAASCFHKLAPGEILRHFRECCCASLRLAWYMWQCCYAVTLGAL